MAGYVVIFLLFLLQFFYFPIGQSFFEGAKVYVAELLIFVLFLLQFFSKDGFSLKHYKKSLVYASLLLVCLCGFHLLSYQTQTILFGNAFRQQGTFLLLMLVLFAFMSSRISIEKKVKPWFVAGILFVQLVCTLLFIGVGADRPVGTIGEPNALAANIIFLWPWLLFPWPKTVPMKGVAFAGLLFAFLILFVSGSRSGFIALGVQLSFFGVYKLLDSRFSAQGGSASGGRGNDKKEAIKLATLVALVVLVFAYTTPFIGPRTEYEDRGEIWKAAVVAGFSHPILGVGFGNAEYALHEANVALGNKLTGYYVDSAHNLFLDWFVQAGIIGVGVFLFLVYQSFKVFIRKETRNCVLLSGLIAALSFNPASVVSLVALWWLIGQGSREP